LTSSLLLQLISSEDIQLTTIKNPILPIELGNARIIYNKHVFLHYVDLDTIHIQLGKLVSSFNILSSNILHKNNTNKHILSYQGLAESLLSRTEYLINIIKNKVNNLIPHRRAKRGLFNIIGSAEKWLFGTLDSEDGKRFDEAITALQQNQKNIIQHLNAQISLSKHLIDHFNKSLSIIEQNQIKLQNGIEFVWEILQNSLQDTHEYLMIEGILSQINLDCQSLINFLDNLEDAILFAKLNSLHNSIISVSELNETLTYLKANYDRDTVPNFKNILSYYQFLGTQVLFSKDRIIFSIQVPLLKPETYTFHHIYPTPQNHTIIIPKYPYVAQTQNNLQYEKDTCPEIEGIFYCKEVFHEEDGCTTQLIKNLPATSCQFSNLHLKQPLVEQITKNEVLVIPEQKVQIFAKCGSDKYLSLNAPTLITIPHPCEVSIGTRKFINDVRITQGKPLILPELHLDSTVLPTRYLAMNINTVDFKEVYHLKDLASQLTPIQEIHEVSSPTFMIISIVVSCLIIILLMLLYRSQLISYVKLRCQKKKMPHPEAIQPPVELQDIKQTHSIMFAS